MAKKSNTQKAVEKAVKKNPKAFIIAVIAIVLIIAIAIAVVYFAFPDVWQSIVDNMFDDPNNSQGNGNNPALSQGNGDLLIHFVDVGQGDCILIQFPDGKDMVIDCANYNNSSSYKTSTLAYLDQYVTDGQLDYLMLTHCDSDHVYFMDDVLAHYQVDNVFMPNVLATPSNASLQAQIAQLDTSRFTDPNTIDSACYAEFFIAALTEPNCNVILTVDADGTSNTIVISEESYRLVFYCPTQQYYDNSNLNSAEKKNAISPIGILEYNGRKIMLTGDSNEINEPLVMQRTGAIDCDVLKVGHHGSDTSTSNAFLDMYTFEYAIISCNAQGNTFYHPRQTTIDRLVAHNIAIYRTDNNGTIVLKVDSEGNITITTQRTYDKAKNEIGLTYQES